MTQEKNDSKRKEMSEEEEEGREEEEGEQIVTIKNTNTDTKK